MDKNEATDYPWSLAWMNHNNNTEWQGDKVAWINNNNNTEWQGDKVAWMNNNNNTFRFRAACRPLRQHSIQCEIGILCVAR